MNTNYADTFYSPRYKRARWHNCVMRPFSVSGSLACRMRCATTTTANTSAPDGTERTVFAISAWHDREREECATMSAVDATIPHSLRPRSVRHHIVITSSRVSLCRRWRFICQFSQILLCSALLQRQYDGCVFVCAGQSSAWKCSRVFWRHGFTSAWWIEIHFMDRTWIILMICIFTAEFDKNILVKSIALNNIWSKFTWRSTDLIWFCPFFFVDMIFPETAAIVLQSTSKTLNLKYKTKRINTFYDHVNRRIFRCEIRDGDEKQHDRDCGTMTRMARMNCVMVTELRAEASTTSGTCITCNLECI